MSMDFCNSVPMNHLQYEKSPYLLQHADNPVDWYPWGEEALQRAREEDKPILLSIGYSTCHWCHVMEHESFEDEDVAAYMNAHFINIKLDREERPDLDRIYMRVCELLTGSGGWPLNVFLTPGLKPFFAGTYFPPEPRYGRMSWSQVLQTVVYNFYEKRELVEREAERVMKALQEGRQTAASKVVARENEPTDLEDFYKRLSAFRDGAWGGFGRAPKFPQVSSLSFMLAWSYAKELPEAADFVLFTLEKMLQGGICDQLGGGFARYATDQAWRIPHFEKMLYDNGLLLGTLAEAFQVSKKPVFLRALRETQAFLERELRAPEGGFYAALDADSEGREGAYYLWSMEELRELLGEDAGWFAAMHGCTEEGNWEGSNILWRLKEPEEMAAELGMELSVFLQHLAKAREKLLTHRQKRFSLHRDDKLLLGWNALAVSGLAKAAQATGEKSFEESALRTLQFLKKHFYRNEQWYHQYVGEGTDARAAHTPAFLTDLAYLLRALIDVYECTQQLTWLEDASGLATYVIKHFYDEDRKRFYLTAEAGDDLILRPVEDRDSETPSGAAYVTDALFYLAHALGIERFGEVAREVLEAHAPRLSEHPLAWSAWATVLLAEQEGRNEWIIVGPDAQAHARKLAQKYLPLRIFMSTEQPSDLPLFRDRFQPGKTLLYHCHHFSCDPPIAL